MPWSDGKSLAEVQVLDLCRVVSGPFATMQLGDLGADVVKMEPSKGHEARTYGPPFGPRCLARGRGEARRHRRPKLLPR